MRSEPSQSLGGINGRHASRRGGRTEAVERGPTLQRWIVHGNRQGLFCPVQRLARGRASFAGEQQLLRKGGSLRVWEGKEVLYCRNEEGARYQASTRGQAGSDFIAEIRRSGAEAQKAPRNMLVVARLYPLTEEIQESAFDVGAPIFTGEEIGLESIVRGREQIIQGRLGVAHILRLIRQIELNG